MSHALKKWIAVLLVICLPLVAGGSLAASISMQLAQDDCHEDSAMVMPGDDHEADACPDCGLCQLACSGYLTEAGVHTPTVLQRATELPAYLLSFDSLTFTPLLPPPLSRS